MIRFLHVLLVILLFSCSSKNDELKMEDKFYFDVYGNSQLEEITISYLKKYYELNVYDKNNKSLLKFKIYPLIADENYRNKIPKIENIYIEGNSIQSNDKGFRIKIRNTDLRPDSFFVDISYDKFWKINTYGIENTTFSDINDNNSYLITKRVNKNIHSVLIGNSLYPYKLIENFKKEINKKNKK